MPRVAQGPKFVQFFDPVLKALKQLGGSARPSEVVEVVARLKNIPEAQRQEVRRRASCIGSCSCAWMRRRD